MEPDRVHERAACESADAEYSPLWLRLRKTWTFYRYLVERNTVNDAPTGIRILYAKISNCLISILHLLQQGYPGPAVMVLRSMFEATVHLGIILQDDPISRAKLFEDFIHIEREGTFSMEGADESAIQSHRATSRLSEINIILDDLSLGAGALCRRSGRTRRVSTTIPRCANFASISVRVSITNGFMVAFRL